MFINGEPKVAADPNNEWAISNAGEKQTQTIVERNMYKSCGLNNV